MKYRKKPVVIDAVQFIFQPEKMLELSEFLPDDIAPKNDNEGNMFLEIPTLEGVMRANEFDFIIKGVNGEFYPCKPDIFNKTYDLVKEN